MSKPNVPQWGTRLFESVSLDNDQRNEEEISVV